jgi:hypothetical protein
LNFEQSVHNLRDLNIKLSKNEQPTVKSLVTTTVKKKTPLLRPQIGLDQGGLYSEVVLNPRDIFSRVSTVHVSASWPESVLVARRFHISSR